VTATQTRAPEPLPGDLSSRKLGRHLAAFALLLVLIAALISTLPGLDQVRDRFQHASPLWLVASALLELCSCLAYVVAFRGVFCRRLGWRFSYEVGMAEQATNVFLPFGGVGGLALGAWALRQGGMNVDRIARRSVAFFVVTSIPNYLCTAVAATLIVFGAPSGHAPLWVSLAFAVAAWLTMLIVALLPRFIDWLSGRKAPKVGESLYRRMRRAMRTGATTVADGVRDAIMLVRSRQPYTVLGAAGYMGFDLLALAAAFAAFGTVPSLAAFVLAYTVGQLGGLIPLPGGIGGTDGGLIAALLLYGSPLSQATAAVLAYRAFQLGLPAILGSIAFLQLRRTLARDAAPAALCEPFEADLPVVSLPARA
jgi:uncharacterized protein (TIRG00374 family)